MRVQPESGLFTYFIYQYHLHQLSYPVTRYSDVCRLSLSISKGPYGKAKDSLKDLAASFRFGSKELSVAALSGSRFALKTRGQFHGNQRVFGLCFMPHFLWKSGFSFKKALWISFYS